MSYCKNRPLHERRAYFFTLYKLKFCTCPSCGILIFPNTAWLVPPSYAKRIHSLMAASKETPKKLAFASNSNKESFRGNSCRLCKCDLKYKLVILDGTYLLKIFLIPLARKVLKKGLWISLFTKTWVLPSSKLRNTHAEFAPNLP